MQQLNHYKDLILPVLKKFAIKKAAIFGSIAKGLATENSDLDLLIEPGLNFTLFNMLQMESEISLLINRKIDVVEFSAIKTSISNEVLHSAIKIL